MIRSEQRKNVVSWKSFIFLSDIDIDNENDKEKQMWLHKLATFPLNYSLILFLSYHQIMLLIIAKCVLRIFFFIKNCFIVRTSVESLESSPMVESKKKTKLKVFNEFSGKSWKCFWFYSDRKYQLTARLHLNDASLLLLFSCNKITFFSTTQLRVNKKKQCKIELHTFLIFLI